MCRVLQLGYYQLPITYELPGRSTPSEESRSKNGLEGKLLKDFSLPKGSAHVPRFSPTGPPHSVARPDASGLARKLH